jgi:hypothetical protein
MNKSESEEDRLRKEKLSEILNRNKKNYRNATFFGIIATLLGLIFAIISLIQTKKSQLNIDQEKIKIDSVQVQERKLLDSILVQKKLHDKLCYYTLEFLNAEKNDSNIKKYYAPILELYYDKKNISLNYIIENKRRFVSQYPKSKFVFKIEGVTSRIIESNSADITATGLFYPDSLGKPTEMIYKIRINLNDYKIYRINNYTPNFSNQ